MAESKPFHSVQGLTVPEYEDLRRQMRNPWEFFPELNRTDLKVALGSALYHADLFAKVEQTLKALSSMRAFGRPEAQMRAMAILRDLETRDLYLMRDVPARGAMDWSRNKARLAFGLDNDLIGIAECEFPNDQWLAARMARNRRRWQSKRLPGVDRRLKPGPKTGKRKRLQKRKEQSDATRRD